MQSMPQLTLSRFAGNLPMSELATLITNFNVAADVFVDIHVAPEALLTLSFPSVQCRNFHQS